jgi:hypothetical protein
MALARQFASKSWVQRVIWRLETVLSGPDQKPLPPHPAEDPGYWEMIDIIREAWGQTCEAALSGTAPLDFEAFFLARATDGLRRAELSAAGKEAAVKEIDKRLGDRREVLANVRIFDRRCPDRGDLRRVSLMCLHREVGMIQYQICPAREHGWLAKINIDLDFARGGLGRRGLDYLSARYPGATWTTSGQQPHARGFWSTMQGESAAGWTPLKETCPHGWNPMAPPGRPHMRSR